MRRRKLALALAVLAVVVAAVIVLSPRPGRVTEANFRRIQRGMTLAEAKAILGEPTNVLTVDAGDGVSACPIVYWEGRAGYIALALDSSGNVDTAGWRPRKREFQNASEWLEDRLHQLFNWG
jgi:hypothetical protein